LKLISKRTITTRKSNVRNSTQLNSTQLNSTSKQLKLTHTLKTSADVWTSSEPEIIMILAGIILAILAGSMVAVAGYTLGITGNGNGGDDDEMI
jgi:hypothetical protein